MALSNATRHARASSALLSVDRDESYVSLTVRDDGDGFDPATVPGVEDGHLGLTVMRERARGHGGGCDITSTPGKGTLVTLWIPL